MRSGNWRVGSIAWAWIAVLGVVFTTEAQAAERVITIPLGGSHRGQADHQYYGVYVPTRFGGELTIKSTEGKVVEIKGPNGQERSNGQEIGVDQQGWYTFRVIDAKKPYQIETKFVQVGQSARKPWNFYYWPTKGDSIHEPWAGGNGRVDTVQVRGDDRLVATPGGYIAPGQDIVLPGPNGLLETVPAEGDDITWFPNLYDDLTWLGPNNTLHQTPSPLLKYDQIFGTAARQYEAGVTQSQDISRWPGHCLGGAVASIQLNEPMPAPGSGMTKDELKALWAELGENHLNHRIGDYCTDIPAGPPRPGYDPCDSKVARFHAVLETHIRGEKKGLLANLRAFPPRGTTAEVWNHGVGKYIAEFKSIPGRGPRAVHLSVELHANSGSLLNDKGDTQRVIKYEYSLVYGLDGRVDETNPAATDWISVGGEALYCPLNLLEVAETRWAGHNPHVTEANIRALDLANGGGFDSRIANRAPVFKPVGQYEAGRVPMFASGGNENYTSEPPRRGGFFRTFFGR
jgi:hypothetical protein